MTDDTELTDRQLTIVAAQTIRAMLENHLVEEQPFTVIGRMAAMLTLFVAKTTHNNDFTPEVVSALVEHAFTEFLETTDVKVKKSQH